MSIKPLNKETIKLINSGQIISSIYSAIKELVENSLDARAENIEVNLVDNGLSLIEVRDNGCGINRNDAQYMALPAYTSKISDFNDLDLLSTYGFRGEGLTSVCQVADVTISTKTEEDQTMLHYTLNHDGHVMASELSHGLTGTTVQMKNLFKNMPVRRNILNNKKRINQEMKAIELLLKMFAICKPSVRFMLRVNSQTVFTKVTCKTTVEAIKSVLGMQYFSKLVHITKNFDQTNMQLFIPNKDVRDISEISKVGLQFICVNDRPIKSTEIEKKINKRISDYFDESACKSRKYIFCLILKVDSSRLDVNLEPNKDKVFLHNEAVVLDQLDKYLLNFYELQDSQMLTQQTNIENVKYNGNVIKSNKFHQIEKEWPSCKRQKINSNNDDINNTGKLNQNISIENQLENDTRKKSDNDFLKSINGPILSDSDSNNTDDFNKKVLSEKDKVPEMMDTPNLDNEDKDSELFDIAQDIFSKDQIIEETLSQLPKVDLGEDFDWQEIMDKDKKLNEKTSKNTEITSDKITVTDEVWSKGQVPDLPGGVAIGFCNEESNDNNSRDLNENVEDQSEESLTFDFQNDINIIEDSQEYIDDNNIFIPENINFEWDVNVKNTRKRTPLKEYSEKSGGTFKKVKRSLTPSDDPNQTKIPFAGDIGGLTNRSASAFAMYCAEARTRILKEHPELTPAEVAVFMNQQWAHIAPEERQYYRDLANQQNQTVNNASSSQTSKKIKQLSQAEKEKNRKQLVTMLQNMKVNKTEAKKENIVMRTSTIWNISIPMIKEKSQISVTKVKRSVIGPLCSKVWIINMKSKLFALDVTELLDGLNIKEYNLSQVDANYIKDIVDKWITEKNDMSLFHPLNSLDES